MPADKDSFRRQDQPAGRVAELLSKLSQLRGHGPGAGLGVLIQDLLLPPQSRRVKRDEHPAEAYPQPDRLRHPMSQARFGAGMERPAPRRSSVTRILHEPAWQPRFRGITARAAPHAPSRKGARSAAPKVPSIDRASLKGWAPSAQPAVSSLAMPLKPALFCSCVLQARQSPESPGIGRTGRVSPKVISPPNLQP
jgi:hypothetical protein